MFLTLEINILVTAQLTQIYFRLSNFEMLEDESSVFWGVKEAESFGTNAAIPA